MNNNIKRLYLLWLSIFTGFICGCWSSEKEQTIITSLNYTLTYNGDIRLERVLIQPDDMQEIIGLYQEAENKDNTTDFKDSLLIAKVFAQWRWVNTFAQDNLDTLTLQWLTLENIEKKQIWIKKNWQPINCVIIEYDITQWFIDDVPILYVSQLFIPDNWNIILYSFTTEDETSRKNASNMFKVIK